MDEIERAREVIRTLWADFSPEEESFIFDCWKKEEEKEAEE